MLDSDTFAIDLITRSNADGLTSITNSSVEYCDIPTTIPNLDSDPVVVLSSTAFNIYFNITN